MSRLDAIELLLGYALITTGVAMWSVPAAFVVAGALLVAFSVLVRRRAE